ncbi:hypothetical protein J0H58_30110 [bacterium]|nr:hypothetical protein [bacterium]
MRFFTLNWWRGCQTGDASNPCADSGRHLDAVRARLPADLLALQESISLHDAATAAVGRTCWVCSAKTNHLGVLVFNEPR